MAVKSGGACRGSSKLQGTAAPDQDEQSQAKDAVHGHSLGAAALLVTATRSVHHSPIEIFPSVPFFLLATIVQ